MGKFKNFGLILIGIVIGVAISFSTDIHAATSKLLGGKVTKVITVKKDGNVIGDGGIINGTTYLPVRTVVNSINGIEVGSVTSTEVNLVTDSSEDDVTTGEPVNNADTAKQEQAEMDKQVKDIDSLTNEIRLLKIKIKNTQAIVDEAKSDTTVRLKEKIAIFEKENEIRPESKAEYDSYKSQLEKITAEADVAKKELESLTSQLTDLESQLAELQK